MKNTYNIVALFGIVLIGIGGFSLAVTAPEVIERIRISIDFSQSVWNEGLMAFHLFGWAYLITGLGLISRARWSKWVSNALLMMTFVAWTIFIFKYIFDSYGVERWILLGISLVLYTINFTSLLLINNKKFEVAFKQDDSHSLEHEDILDLD